jgi:hypothetical protein
LHKVTCEAIDDPSEDEEHEWHSLSPNDVSWVNVERDRIELLRTVPAPIAVSMDNPIKNQSKLLPKLRIRFKNCLVSREDMNEEQNTYPKIRHLGFRLFIVIVLISISGHSLSRFSHRHGALKKEPK